MTKTKVITPFAIGLGTAVLALGALTLSVATAEAYRGDPGVQRPDCSPERHLDMEQAFETNNYQAWEVLMAGKGRVTEVVNAENFAQFARAHTLAQAGDIEGAKEVRQSLGLGVGGGQHRGERAGAGNSYGKSNQHGHQRNN